MKKALFVILGLVLIGCSDNGTSVKCVDDNDCPQGQQCIAGNCQLPADEGPKTCQTINDCGIGEDCINGICVDISYEPDAGGEDGGGDPGGDPGGDHGSDPGSDPAADQDTTDYSALNFRVAVSRGGTSGPATQCALDVHPAAGAGPVLPILPLPGGYTLSGTVTSGAGADVTVEHQFPECVPAPVKADGGGNFTFYLPQGSHTLQAVLAGRLVAYDTVNLSGNTSRTMTFPTGTDITGGPLFISGPVDLNNWKVYAHFKTGALAGKLAHPGVLTGPNPIGVFTIPLPEGVTYDLLGYPPANEPYPQQILYEDVDPGDPQDWDLGSHMVREGVTFSGQVTVGGNGSPGASVDLKNFSDPRLTAHGETVTNGNFQVLVRPGSFSIDVMPSAAAFAQGACGYMHPQFSLYTDQNATIDLQTGTPVVFSGRIQDTQGSGIQGANVRLILVPRDVVEQDISICNPAPVQTDANGSFNITCNLLP